MKVESKLHMKTLKKNKKHEKFSKSLSRAPYSQRKKIQQKFNADFSSAFEVEITKSGEGVFLPYKKLRMLFSLIKKHHELLTIDHIISIFTLISSIQEGNSMYTIERIAEFSIKKLFTLIQLSSHQTAIDPKQIYQLFKNLSKLGICHSDFLCLYKKLIELTAFLENIYSFRVVEKITVLNTLIKIDVPWQSYKPLLNTFLSCFHCQEMQKELLENLANHTTFLLWEILIFAKQQKDSPRYIKSFFNLVNESIEPSNNITISYTQNAFFNVISQMIVNESLTKEYQIGPYSVDIALPAHKIAFEVDGPHHYRMRRLLPKDTLRDNLLQKCFGWRTVRFPFFQSNELTDQQKIVYIQQKINRLGINLTDRINHIKFPGYREVNNQRTYSQDALSRAFRLKKTLYQCASSDVSKNCQNSKTNHIKLLSDESRKFLNKFHLWTTQGTNLNRHLKQFPHLVSVSGNMGETPLLIELEALSIAKNKKEIDRRMGCVFILSKHGARLDEADLTGKSANHWLEKFVNVSLRDEVLTYFKDSLPNCVPSNSALKGEIIFLNKKRQELSDFFRKFYLWNTRAPKLINVLKKSPSLVRATDRSGKTPLLIELEALSITKVKGKINRRLGCVQVLSKYGASLTEADLTGKSARQWLEDIKDVSARNTIFSYFNESATNDKEKLSESSAGKTKIKINKKKTLSEASNFLKRFDSWRTRKGKLDKALAQSPYLVNITDSSGKTPLLIELEALSTATNIDQINRRLGCVQILSKHGASLNEANLTGKTARKWLEEIKNISLQNEILSYFNESANKNEKISNKSFIGKTRTNSNRPLSEAFDFLRLLRSWRTQAGKLNKLLTQLPYLVSITDSSGKTPLLIELEALSITKVKEKINRRLGCVKILSEHGADLTEMDFVGKTARQWIDEIKNTSLRNKIMTYFENNNAKQPQKNQPTTRLTKKKSARIVLTRIVLDNKKETKCAVISVASKGDCGFLAIKRSLMINRHNELSKQITRLGLISLVRQYQNSPAYTGIIAEILQYDKSKTLEDWALAFIKPGVVWIAEHHLRFLSKALNLCFHIYCVKENKFVPEPSYERIDEVNAGASSIDIHLAHVSTNPDNLNIPLNHFEGLCIEPYAQQLQQIINWTKDKQPSVSPSLKNINKDKSLASVFSKFKSPLFGHHNQFTKRPEKQSDHINLKLVDYSNELNDALILLSCNNSAKNKSRVRAAEQKIKALEDSIISRQEEKEESDLTSPGMGG